MFSDFAEGAKLYGVLDHWHDRIAAKTGLASSVFRSGFAVLSCGRWSHCCVVHHSVVTDRYHWFDPNRFVLLTWNDRWWFLDLDYNIWHTAVLHLDSIYKWMIRLDRCPWWDDDRSTTSSTHLQCICSVGCGACWLPDFWLRKTITAKHTTPPDSQIAAVPFTGENVEPLYNNRCLRFPLSKHRLMFHSP